MSHLLVQLYPETQSVYVDGILWSLIINLKHSLALNLHRQGDILAGVNIYSAATSHRNTD